MYSGRSVADENTRTGLVNSSSIITAQVMEKLEKDLTSVSTAVPLHYPEVQLKQVLTDISEALMLAKWQGIAHIDVKPDNIFVSGSHYKLAAFCSACDINREKLRPDGTPAYMSPIAV